MHILPPRPASNERVTDLSTVGSTGELDIAFHQRVEGVVSAHPNIAARVELGATLTNDNVAWNNIFTYKMNKRNPLHSVPRALY